MQVEVFCTISSFSAISWPILRNDFEWACQCFREHPCSASRRTRPISKARWWLVCDHPSAGQNQLVETDINDDKDEEETSKDKQSESNLRKVETITFHAISQFLLTFLIVSIISSRIQSFAWVSFQLHVGKVLIVHVCMCMLLYEVIFGP